MTVNIWEHLMSFRKMQVRRTLCHRDIQRKRGHHASQWALGRAKVPTYGRVRGEKNSTLLWWCCTGSGVLPRGTFRPLYLFISNGPAMPRAAVSLDLMKSTSRCSATESALPFNPPATQSVLQVCYRNHFIQHRYAQVSRVESGSCSTHSLIETLLTISICFAIVTRLCP